MVEVRLTGTLQFHSETGTEGGYWAFQDGRGVHYAEDLVDDKCPWGEDYPMQLDGETEITYACPANPRYWRGSDCPPERMAHATYYGLVMLDSGDHLTVYDKNDMTHVIFDGPVRLEQQDPYAPTSDSAGGLAIHSTPVGQDTDAWAEMFFNEHPAVLVKHHPNHYLLDQLEKLEKLGHGPTPDDAAGGDTGGRDAVHRSRSRPR